MAFNKEINKKYMKSFGHEIAFDFVWCPDFIIPKSQ